MKDAQPIMSPTPENKQVVTVFLSRKDFRQLDEICKARGQSKADFLRAAIQVHEHVPLINTRPLVGACLEKHRKRVQRERRAAQRAEKRKG